jgi:hypothetical protein
MEESAEDDFLPLKELAKKFIVEPKEEEVVVNVPETKAETVTENQAKIRPESHVKTMSQENLADLRSVLASVMKKTEPKKVEIPVKTESKPEAPKIETVKIEESKPEPKLEIKKEEPKKLDAEKPKVEESGAKEISEEELRKILGV